MCWATVRRMQRTTDAGTKSRSSCCRQEDCHLSPSIPNLATTRLPNKLLTTLNNFSLISSDARVGGKFQAQTPATWLDFPGFGAGTDHSGLIPGSGKIPTICCLGRNTVASASVLAQQAALGCVCKSSVSKRRHPHHIDTAGRFRLRTPADYTKQEILK